ncbi:ABC transporter A family member [Acrasis kona]|uniref:ABC transporter A family member n=1 Tax=Acrasis kona TaxID=1008807 RepID=A0AAW2ZJT4_9EUKA
MDITKITNQPITVYPTYTDVLKNLRAEEVGATLAWTALSGVVGFAQGFPFRKDVALCGAAFSLLMGGSIISSRTYQRLGGYRENSRELKKNGIPERRLVEIVRKRTLVNPARQEFDYRI